MSNQDTLDGYIARLRAELAGMSLHDREEIVDEIRTHVRERVEEFNLTPAEAVARLGPAEDLAAGYCRGALVRRARKGFSPWLIFRAAYAWAVTGVQGFTVFLVAFMGYTLGAAFVIAAMLKPVFPAETGLWIGPGTFNFGFQPGHGGEAQEVLGPWFPQVSLLLGVLCIAGTALATRAMLPKFRKWRATALDPAAR
jgi:hypothetical protein